MERPVPTENRPTLSDPSPVARTVLEQRCLRRDEHGTVVETPAELVERVATAVASVEDQYGNDPNIVASEFAAMLDALYFLPNSPTLSNAGTGTQQLAACFVLPVEDSLESIFGALGNAALVHQTGGGTGFSFSRLRPSGDVVGGSGGVASGPVSFMKIFDCATEQVKQGGRRRGANMGVLAIWHPDVETFVTAKRTEGVLRNFNLSVATDARFWAAVSEGSTYDLVNPRTGTVTETVDAGALLDEIAAAAWESGDPGIVFLDAIAAANPTPALGSIEATNPCGETPLLPYEACVLGSVNLARMTTDGGIDWDRLGHTVRLAIRFLDDAIDACTYPLPEIEAAVTRTRKLGFGVMGFHDLLVDLGISYDSDEAVAVAEEMMAFVSEEAWEASADLAAERGTFPAFGQSELDGPVRNATTTAIAPTGTLSLVAGCTSGIEPMYGVAYEKHVLGGLELVNERFVDIARTRGFDTPALLATVRDRTSIQDVDTVPADVRRLFQTAHDVSPVRHLEIQAAFQQHTDNGVSKTVNLPESATVEDVRDVYELARELDVKGITVFRSGCRREQVLGSNPLEDACLRVCDGRRQ
ncbi:adenosylcobalamin-dependent ribonucleoside-diphosphate reductase [Haloarchaeobius sp. TZWWS8]|uniref:adenosylcobalamin-dependent ribonucleoside-diphosphate reductase n=1 Tax=Haloarchaeobius sp. TZWWS8 TaxID=3446121 RepID=UPI003EB705DD